MLLLAVGLVIGISTVIALWSLTGSLGRDLDQQWEQGTRLISIVPQSRQFALTYNGVSMATSNTGQPPLLEASDLLAVVAAHGGSTAPKLVQLAEVEGHQVLAVGVDFAAEQALKPWRAIKSGQWPVESGQLLLGEGLAQQLGKAPGDNLKLQSTIYSVAGVLAGTGQPEDQVLLMDLTEAQQQFARDNKVSFVEALAPAASLAELRQQLADKAPHVQLQVGEGLQEARRELVVRFVGFATIITLVVLLIGCLIVMITVSAAVNERVNEIGILAAIGYGQRQITRLILLETSIVAVLAAVGGYLLGWGAIRLVAPWMGVTPVLPFWWLGLTVLATVAIGVLASLYPAIRAARMDPVEALRSL